MKYPVIRTFFKLIFFVTIAWLLIHFLGLFGILLAIAYPIWWLFLPRQTLCFYCHTHKNQAHCPLCKKSINKDTGTSPENIKSAVFNSFLILAVSALSLGFIFAESHLLARMGVVSIQKTAILEIPKGGEYKVGESFAVDLNIKDLQTVINAFQVDIKYDSTVVEALDIKTNDSFANIFVQREINNELGYIRFSGGLPNPGHNKPEAHVGTIYFKGIASGVTPIRFLPSSMILANDGNGTNVLKSYTTASYIITPSSPDDIFPDISHIFQEMPTSSATTQIDFTRDDNVIQKPNALNTQPAKQKTSLNPFYLVGALNRFILDLWQF